MDEPIGLCASSNRTIMKNVNVILILMCSCMHKLNDVSKY